MERKTHSINERQIDLAHIFLTKGEQKEKTNSWRLWLSEKQVCILVIEAVSGSSHSFMSPSKSQSQSCFCQGLNDKKKKKKTALGICHCPGDKSTRIRDVRASECVHVQAAHQRTTCGKQERSESLVADH